MVDWFHANFEDPVHETPYNGQEGGYQYIWGGPYDARDELQTYFDDATDEEFEAAIAEIETDGLTDWAPNGSRIQPDGSDDDEDRPESLVQRLEGLQEQLDQIEAQLRKLPSQPSMLGHNQPPEEFRIYLEPPEVQDALKSIEEVRQELDKPDALDKADPEVVERAEGRLRRIANKIASLAKLAFKGVLAGALSQVGKELVDNPMSLVLKIENVVSTLAAWVHHLHLPL